MYLFESQDKELWDIRLNLQYNKISELKLAINNQMSKNLQIKNCLQMDYNAKEAKSPGKAKELQKILEMYRDNVYVVELANWIDKTIQENAAYIFLKQVTSTDNPINAVEDLSFINFEMEGKIYRAAQRSLELYDELFSLCLKATQELGARNKKADLSQQEKEVLALMSAVKEVLASEPTERDDLGIGAWRFYSKGHKNYGFNYEFKKIGAQEVFSNELRKEEEAYLLFIEHQGQIGFVSINDYRILDFHTSLSPLKASRFSTLEQANRCRDEFLNNKKKIGGDEEFMVGVLKHSLSAKPQFELVSGSGVIASVVQSHYLEKVIDNGKTTHNSEIKSSTSSRVGAIGRAGKI